MAILSSPGNNVTAGYDKGIKKVWECSDRDEQAEVTTPMI
jgi:hypothetical protein